MKSLPLQTKLLFYILGLITCLWCIGLTLAGYHLKAELNKVFDSVLQETAERIFPLALVEILNRDDVKVFQQLPALSEYEERVVYRVVNSMGEVLLKSHNAGDHLWGGKVIEGFKTTENSRIYSLAAIQKRYFIQVLEPLNYRQVALKEAVMLMALPLIFLLPLSFLAVLWLVRKLFKPVKQLSIEVSNRSARDLVPISIDQLPQELLPIPAAINQLMKQVQVALDAERHFTANAAHELRTPLATMKAQIQRLEKRVTDPEYKGKLSQLRISLDHLINLSDKLLQLAKADALSLKLADYHPLTELMIFIIEDFRRSGFENLTLKIPEHEVFAAVDIDAVAIIVKNIVDNALKYRSNNEPVLVELTYDAKIVVSNDCEPLKQENIDNLCNRFYRAPSEQTGSGLGLAIVSTLVNKMGGSIYIESPIRQSHRGFQIVVQLKTDREMNNALQGQ